MRRSIIIVFGVIVLVLGGFAAYLLLSPDGASEVRASQVVKDQAQWDKTVVVFARNPYKDDYEITRIAGYVDNVSKTDVAKVKLEIRLLDGDGNRKETVKYEVVNIPAASRKTFDANAGAIGGSRRAEVKVVGLEVYK